MIPLNPKQKKPPMTEAEFALCQHMAMQAGWGRGYRAMAAAISHGRGSNDAVSPERRRMREVSHTWVRLQLGKRKLEESGNLRNIHTDDKAETNQETRAILDPERHQEGKNPTFPNLQVNANGPEGEEATMPAIGLKENGGRKTAFNDLKDDQEASIA